GAELQRDLGAAHLQGLRIGVGADEIDTVDLRVEHVGNGVTAATADANDLYACIGGEPFDEFKHVPLPPLGGYLTFVFVHHRPRPDSGGIAGRRMPDCLPV